MATEREIRALRIARSIFEHYTRDSMTLAKEILDLERELAMDDPEGVRFDTVNSPPQAEVQHAEVTEEFDQVPY